MRRAAALATWCALLAAVAHAQPAPAPPIVELRVHGNHSTPTEDILSLSGLAVGQPATAEALESARAKVEASGRFAAVAVRRLERSLDVPDDIMVMVLVEERAAVSPEQIGRASCRERV